MFEYPCLAKSFWSSAEFVARIPLKYWIVFVKFVIIRKSKNI